MLLKWLHAHVWELYGRADYTVLKVEGLLLVAALPLWLFPFPFSHFFLLERQHVRLYRVHMGVSAVSKSSGCISPSCLAHRRLFRSPTILLSNFQGESKDTPHFWGDTNLFFLQFPLWTTGSFLMTFFFSLAETLDHHLSFTKYAKLVLHINQRHTLRWVTV